MVALLLTALATAYFVVPKLLSLFILGNFVERKIKSASRNEELVSGAVWSLVPLAMAWWSRRWIFFKLPNDSAYYTREVFKALAASTLTDPFFHSFRIFCQANGSLLARIYVLVLAGSTGVGYLGRNFGKVRTRVKKKSFWAKLLHWGILSRVSEWHGAFTAELRCNPASHSIEADVMTKSGKLYRGPVQNIYIGPDGSLQTLILEQAERFLRTDYVFALKEFEQTAQPAVSAMPSHPDRPSRNDYWRRIPGEPFFILGSDISTVNGRQVSVVASVLEPTQPEHPPEERQDYQDLVATMQQLGKMVIPSEAEGGQRPDP